MRLYKKAMSNDAMVLIIITILALLLFGFIVYKLGFGLAPLSPP